MEQSWDRILVFGLSINLIGHCVCTYSDVRADDAALVDDSVFYPDSAEDGGEINKRLSQFVRIGKALSSFVRIGKSDPDQEEYFNSADVADDNSIEKRKSAFVRIGRGDMELETPDKRLSSFVRIGRMLPDYEKRGGAFIRMGKFPSSAYLRNRARLLHSISPQPYFRRRGRFGKSSFIRIGKRDTMDALARKANNDNGEEDQYQNGINRNHFFDREPETKTSSASQELVEKYSSNGFAEADGDFGYNTLDNTDTDMDKDKRYSKIVRIGRNGGSWKQESDMDELAGSDDTRQTADKRRGSSFVRIGRNQLTAEEQPMLDLINKRLSQFVRIGKSGYPSFPGSDEMAKRMSSFVRIGKRGTLDNENNGDVDGKLDKRMSSFVRIGKNSVNPDSTLLEDKRMTSIVRIGKKSEPANSAAVDKTSAVEDITKEVHVDMEADESKQDTGFM